jgi:molybdopterin synthase sulfur carrier subunit
VNAGNRGVSDATPPLTPPAPPPNPPDPGGVIRYWAAAREAAGVSAEPYAAATLAQALAAAKAKHGSALEQVLARCAFVVDGTPASRRDPATVVLSEGGTIEVLPPFAGGSATMPGCRRP